jgi:hypothetical protein
VVRRVSYFNAALVAQGFAATASVRECDAASIARAIDELGRFDRVAKRRYHTYEVEGDPTR